MAPLRIGIFGGSFNPIHNGHLTLARTVSDAVGLDRLIFIPAGFPPHKPRGRLADPEHRYAMACIAAAEDPRFEVSRLELDSTETSYTVTTMRAFRSLFKPEDALYFVMGADSLVDLVNWRSFPELATLCTFVAAARPGISRETLAEHLTVLEGTHGARIRLVEMVPQPLSASDIRRRVAAGESIEGLTPTGVAAYIAAHGLYRSGNGD